MHRAITCYTVQKALCCSSKWLRNFSSFTWKNCLTRYIQQTFPSKETKLLGILSKTQNTSTEDSHKVQKANQQGLRRRDDVRVHTQREKQSRWERKRRGAWMSGKEDRHLTLEWDHSQKPHMNLCFTHQLNPWHSTDHIRGGNSYQG